MSKVSRSSNSRLIVFGLMMSALGFGCESSGSSNRISDFVDGGPAAMNSDEGEDSGRDPTEIASDNDAFFDTDSESSASKEDTSTEEIGTSGIGESDETDRKDETDGSDETQPSDNASDDTDSASSDGDPSSDEERDTEPPASDDVESDEMDTAPLRPGVCGDGVLTKDEACDDGNQVDEDGCAGDCLSVEVGYSCNPAGVPCHKVARCGDGIVTFPEFCDDGNVESMDGCSALCKIEIGYQCEGSPSECRPTDCGNGIIEGTEACDDSNTMPFDGCSAICQAEPDCSGDRCVSECGDGLVIDEECDDGNILDGDGCSSDCRVEPGYKCAPMTTCEEVDGSCVMKISAVFRDFSVYTDPYGDFQGGGDMIQGLIDPSLDKDGKPRALADVRTLSNGSIDSPESFQRWYRDTEDSETLVSTLTLFDNADGGYVNRWKDTGEQWCVDGTCYDGTPVFFPVDSLTDGSDFVEATIPEEYGGNWLPESEFDPDAVPHNYGFTTEVKYWFKYDVDSPATLGFLGDDDMWVFVNGILAVDMGNVHMPKLGVVTIDEAGAETYDLEEGGVYPIQVFHAERNPTGSSFKLTLAGFEADRSVCLPTCGDGIVSIGEECDDGENDGGYGECYEGCKLGDFCGDGIKQENEDCDDGNTLDGDACGSSCRHLVII